MAKNGKEMSNEQINNKGENNRNKSEQETKSTREWKRHRALV